jgi:hypothetical protein
MNIADRLRDPVAVTGLATAVGYSLILLVMFALLFVVPFLIVTAL